MVVSAGSILDIIDHPSANGVKEESDTTDGAALKETGLVADGYWN